MTRSNNHQPRVGRTERPRSVVMLSTVDVGGIRAVVDSYRCTPLFSDWRIQDIHTHRAGSIGERTKTYLLAFCRATMMLVRREVLLIHAHTAMRGSFWRKLSFLVVAKLFRVPFIAHLHGSEFEEFFYNSPAFTRKAIQLFLKESDGVIVLSQHWRSVVVEICPSAKPTIVRNFPPPNGFGSPRSYQNQSTKCNLLFLGVLGARKGIFDLINAVADLRMRGVSLELHVGGNGALPEAKALVATLKLECTVFFYGWVGADRKAELLRAADIFVLPSHNEGLPISVLEAMQASVPVVSTTVGGIPELINSSEVGILVEPGNIPALTNAIGRLCADRPLRHQIARQAYERVSTKFSQESAVAALQEIYTSVTENR